MWLSLAYPNLMTANDFISIDKFDPRKRQHLVQIQETPLESGKYL